MMNKALVGIGGGQPIQIKECLVHYLHIVDCLSTYDAQVLRNVSDSLKLIIVTMKGSNASTSIDGFEQLIKVYEMSAATAIDQQTKAQELKK